MGREDDFEIDGPALRQTKKNKKGQETLQMIAAGKHPWPDRKLHGRVSNTIQLAEIIKRLEEGSVE